MRNFKNYLILLLIVLINSCQNADQAPEPTIQSSALEPIGEYDDTDPDDDLPGTLMMEITIVYPVGLDRTSFRNDIAAALGYNSYFPCSGNPNVEIWVVPDMTPLALENTLSNIINSYPNYTQQPGTAGGSLGHTPLASILTRSSGSGSQAGSIADKGVTPASLPGDTIEVYYGNVCN